MKIEDLNGVSIDTKLKKFEIKSKNNKTYKVVKETNSTDNIFRPLVKNTKKASGVSLGPQFKGSMTIVETFVPSLGDIDYATLNVSDFNLNILCYTSNEYLISILCYLFYRLIMLIQKFLN